MRAVTALGSALVGARWTPVLEFRGGAEWPGPPVPTEREARDALIEMQEQARAPIIAARIDVSGAVRVPLRDLVIVAFPVAAEPAEGGR